MASILQQSVTKAALAFVCGGVLLAVSLAIAAEVTFKGKTIDIFLGSASGGGTDGTTRLVGTFLEKYLPGNPAMRYRNLPGGHGAKALNYFVSNRVKPDGLTWVGGSSAHIDPAALIKGVVEYDPTKFEYFGGIERGGSILFIRKDKLANLTDKSKPPVVVGVIDGNRSWEQMVTWGADILNWNVRFVVGYPGTSFLLLAIRRGETHMMGTSNLSLLKEMFETGEYVGVTQLGDERSTFKDIPPFPNLVAGKVSGLAKETFEFWSQLNALDKWYALPPKTPKDIVDAYRTAWSKAIVDPAFIKQGKLLFSEDFTPTSGEKLSAMAKATSYPKKEILAYMEQLKAKYDLPAEALSDEELAALAKKKGLDKVEIPAVQTVLTKVGDGGRDVEFKVGDATRKIDVSDKRTKVTISGKKAERAELKSGLSCTIEYMDEAKEANGIDCK
jgi:tripartite-type tricarboxylate transporter receptor subunit TctC